MLAAAGLRRLGIAPPHAEPCDPREFVPAIGQGALALEIAPGRGRRAARAPIEHRAEPPGDRRRARVPRAPSAVPASRRWPRTRADRRRSLTLRALIAHPDGTRIVRGERRGAAGDGARLGARARRASCSREGGAETAARARAWPDERDRAGTVYLVGAGPGAPGLHHARRARAACAQADVVIYDYLASPRLLDHAPARAERILVGKHGGGQRVEQAVITALLLERARRGLTVVRLKGGDPFVFGRGGEEAEALAAAGIPFEVVPGVTSAVAVPAYAGIPLTHRDLASSFTVLTGYEYPDKPEMAVHWDAVAQRGNTLVFLMTTRQLRANMERLLAHGVAPDTPAAVIRWGTVARAADVVGTVATIADLAARRAPAAAGARRRRAGRAACASSSPGSSASRCSAAASS